MDSAPDGQAYADSPPRAQARAQYSPCARRCGRARMIATSSFRPRLGKRAVSMRLAAEALRFTQLRIEERDAYLWRPSVAKSNVVPRVRRARNHRGVARPLPMRGFLGTLAVRASMLESAINQAAESPTAAPTSVSPQTSATTAVVCPRSANARSSSDKTAGHIPRRDSVAARPTTTMTTSAASAPPSPPAPAVLVSSATTRMHRPRIRNTAARSWAALPGATAMSIDSMSAGPRGGKDVAVLDAFDPVTCPTSLLEVASTGLRDVLWRAGSLRQTISACSRAGKTSDTAPRMTSSGLTAKYSRRYLRHKRRPAKESRKGRPSS